jgi:hypothetical protein
MLQIPRALARGRWCSSWCRRLQRFMFFVGAMQHAQKSRFLGSLCWPRGRRRIPYWPARKDGSRHRSTISTDLTGGQNKMRCGAGESEAPHDNWRSGLGAVTATTASTLGMPQFYCQPRNYLSVLLLCGLWLGARSKYEVVFWRACPVMVGCTRMRDQPFLFFV